MHNVEITRSTRISQRLAADFIGDRAQNQFVLGWYIRCHSCGWAEKAGDETTAIARAARHKEGAKLP